MEGWRDRFGLVRVSAQILRDLGLTIVHSPAEIPGHVEALGHKNKRIGGIIAETASWVVGPPAVIAE